MRILIALVVWAGAVVGAAGLSTVVADSIHTTGTAAASSSFDASTVKATDSDSLFRTANLERALALARTHLGAGAQIDRFVLYPGYLDLTAVKAGSEADVYIDASGRYEPTSTGGNPGDSPLFSLTRIKADAPAALAQRIAGATQVPEAQLNYMIAQGDPSTHHFQWLVYTLHGSAALYFQTSGPNGPLFELRTNSSTGLQRVRG